MTPLTNLGYALTTALLTPALLVAQRVSPSLQLTREEVVTEAGSVSALGFAPSFTVDGARWRIDARLAGQSAPHARAPLTGEFAMAALGPVWGPVRGEVTAHFMEAALAGGTTDARAGVRAHLAAPTRGLWTGIGYARHGKEDLRTVEVGGWWAARGRSFSLRLADAIGVPGSRTEDGPIGPDSLPRPTRRPTPAPRVRSVSATLLLADERVELTGAMARRRGGVQRGLESFHFGAKWWVTPVLGVLTGHGPVIGQDLITGPSSFRFGVMLRPYPGPARRATLMMDPATVPGRIERVAEGRYRFRIAAPGAERVELQGSATGWEAIAMQRIRNGWWECELPIAAGRHEFTWRKDDGPWSPIPGLPTAHDALLGTVTVVVTGP